MKKKLARILAEWAMRLDPDMQVKTVVGGKIEVFAVAGEQLRRGEAVMIKNSHD
jgi:hypothetical protein